MGGEQASEARARALHRRRLLGVVADYLVDWGGRRFDVLLTGADGRQIADTFLRYVEQAQPGRGASYEAIVARERWEPPEQGRPGCAPLAIQVVFDTGAPA